MNIFQKFHLQNYVRTASHPHSSVLLSLKNTIIFTVLTIVDDLHRRLSSLLCYILNILENWHMKVARLLAINTGPLYPQNSVRSLSCQRLSRTQDLSAAGKTKSLKNLCDPRLPGLQRIASTKCATAHPKQRLMISKLSTCLSICKIFASSDFIIVLIPISILFLPSLSFKCSQMT